MRVVVVGSGIAGAATAHQLSRRGAEVVVIDAGLTGAATAAGAGIVSPWTARADRNLAFAMAAGEYYRTLVEELAEDGRDDSSFEVVGGLVVRSDTAELREVRERLQTRAEASPAAGVVELLDPGEAREFFPPLAAELAAVHVSGAGRVDGRRLRAALLGAARNRGAQVCEGRVELDVDGGRVRGVHLAGERIGADAVVVAAGAWSAALLEPLGVSLGVVPQRGQITHLDLPGTGTRTWPVVLPPSGHYLLAFPESRVVVGATRETGSGFDHRVTASGQREVLEHALTVAPGLAEATLVETRVGFRPATADGLPLLGALAEHPQVSVVSGFGPAGLTIGPYAAQLVARQILGEQVGDELAPYPPERAG
jgi:D-amino-acid dehydrogenase